MTDSDIEIFGPPERGIVFIAEYDPNWARRFEKERAAIAAALVSHAKAIEHIGSTAVSGLAAKPVIDILIAVDDVDEEDRYSPALQGAGYVLRVREPGHRMFRTPERDVHVHLWNANSNDVERHLAFRDRLRSDRADRELYERVKRELAKREWPRRNEYANAKSEVIAAILSRAQNARSQDC